MFQWFDHSLILASWTFFLLDLCLIVYHVYVTVKGYYKSVYINTLFCVYVCFMTIHDLSAISAIFVNDQHSCNTTKIVMNCFHNLCMVMDWIFIYTRTDVATSASPDLNKRFKRQYLVIFIIYCIIFLASGDIEAKGVYVMDVCIYTSSSRQFYMNLVMIFLFTGGMTLVFYRLIQATLLGDPSKRDISDNTFKMCVYSLINDLVANVVWLSMVLSPFNQWTLLYFRIMDIVCSFNLTFFYLINRWMYHTHYSLIENDFKGKSTGSGVEVISITGTGVASVDVTTPNCN